MFYTHSDKTWVFDQSERAQGPIYILIQNNVRGIDLAFIIIIIIIIIIRLSLCFCDILNKSSNSQVFSILFISVN